MKATATVSTATSNRERLQGLFEESLRPGFLLRTAMDIELGSLLSAGAVETSDWQDYSELVKRSLVKKGCSSRLRLVGLTD